MMAASKIPPAQSSATTDELVSSWERERPDLDLRAYSLTLRVTALAMQIGHFGEEVARRLGLKYNEMLLLHALRREGEPYHLRPAEILKKLRVTSGTVTNTTDRLEALDIVRRVPDPEDRRSTLIHLTEKGRKLVDEAVEITVRKAAVDLKAIAADPAIFQATTEALRRLNIAYDQSMTPAENPLVNPRPRRKS